MANLPNLGQRAIEKLLGMESGHVLDFSNKGFQGFVIDSAEIDIENGDYDKYGISKAKRLRAFWDTESDSTVGKLLVDLLHYRQNEAYNQASGLTLSEQAFFNQCLEVAQDLIKNDRNSKGGQNSTKRSQKSDELTKFSNIERRPFEKLFGMDTGFVLDFSDPTFQGFVIDSIGIDLYEGELYTDCGISKANRLRCLWNKESNTNKGRICLDLLERWRNNKRGKGIEITPDEQEQFEKASKIAHSLISSTTSGSDIEKNCEGAAISTESNYPNSSLGEDACLPIRELVFVSYSREDKKWVEELKKFLSPLVDSNKIKLWIDESNIQPGNRWENDIETALSSTKVAVLMLSSNFFNSKFITQKELPRFIQDEKNGLVTLLPVHIAHSIYEDTDVAVYQAVNDPKWPLNRLEEAEKDEALVCLCRRIKAAVEKDNG